MNQLRLLKVRLKVLAIFVRDLVQNNYVRFPQKGKGRLEVAYAIGLEQPFFQSETLPDKIYNLRIAAESINAFVLQPNDLFSFWHIIGNPNTPGKFRKGRIIKNGEIALEVGGGLCQVSGIMYHIALIAGLKIVERYNHSVDIYTESDRYTPLGTDATVAYGYKDLRIVNSYPFPIQFKITVEATCLRVELLSESPISRQQLDFHHQRTGMYEKVAIFNIEQMKVSESVYRKMEVGVPA